MPAFLGDRVFDNGLTVLDTEANRLDVTSQQATTYAEATSTYTLGNATSFSIGVPGDRVGGGRKVTVAAVTDGSVTATGTASHYAIVDTVNSRLLVAAPLSATQAVTNGNTFTLGAFDIGIPDPA